MPETPSDIAPAVSWPMRLWRVVRTPWMSAYSIGKSALTGADGSSWAPGRIMGFAVFLIGQCLVIRASAQQLDKHLDPNNWAAFFQGVAIFEATICSVAIGLVLGMAPTDSGGRWWGKEASPPPPPPSNR
jgi:hypothetical protein